jgi:hypothetical protein
MQYFLSRGTLAHTPWNRGTFCDPHPVFISVDGDYEFQDRHPQKDYFLGILVEVAPCVKTKNRQKTVLFVTNIPE